MEQARLIQKTSPRLNLVIIALVFILPVILAYLALGGNWFKPASTNQGELLQPALSLDAKQLPDSLSGKWLILVPTDQNCAQLCEESIYVAEQTDLALGRESDRVMAARYYTADAEIQTLGNELKYPLSVNSLLTEYIYIADPLGQIILRYPVSEQRDNNLMAGKHMLADLKKLLKLSRVG